MKKIIAVSISILILSGCAINKGTNKYINKKIGIDISKCKIEKDKDIEIYNAVSFVHGFLQDDAPRIPEQVQIFLDDDMDSDSNAYTVRRGQSLLYDLYKIWRQLMLLENALLLNTENL